MIKKWYIIKDEYYNETFEMGGQGGIHCKEEDFIDIALIDTGEVAQNAVECAENVKYDEKIDMLLYHKQDVINNIEYRLNMLKEMLKEEAIEIAFSYIEDSEDSCFID